MAELEKQHFDSNAGENLHFDTKNPRALLTAERPIDRRTQILGPPAELEVQRRGVLVALEESGEVLVLAEVGGVVKRLGFDVVVVEGDLRVWVSDAEVEGEVVVEGCGVREGELGEGCGVDVGFDFGGAIDEPEDEDDDAESEDELDEGAAEAAEAAAA